MGGLVGKFDSKMPLHVQVTSSIPVVLFLFPFPVYFQWTDVTHFQCERPGMVPMAVGAPRLSGSYNTTGYYIPEEDDDALYNVSTEVSSISLHRFHLVSCEIELTSLMCGTDRGTDRFHFSLVLCFHKCCSMLFNVFFMFVHVCSCLFMFFQRCWPFERCPEYPTTSVGWGTEANDWPRAPWSKTKPKPL